MRPGDGAALDPQGECLRGEVAVMMRMANWRIQASRIRARAPFPAPPSLSSSCSETERLAKTASERASLSQIAPFRRRRCSRLSSACG